MPGGRGRNEVEISRGIREPFSSPVRIPGVIGGGSRSTFKKTQKALAGLLEHQSGFPLGGNMCSPSYIAIAGYSRICYRCRFD